MGGALMFSLKRIPSNSLIWSIPGTEMPVPITNDPLELFDGPLSAIMLLRGASSLDTSNGETSEGLVALELLCPPGPNQSSLPVLTYGFSGFVYLSMVSLHTLFLWIRVGLCLKIPLGKTRGNTPGQKYSESTGAALVPIVSAPHLGIFVQSL